MSAHHRIADLLLILMLLALLLLVLLASPLGTHALVSVVNAVVPIIHIEGESGTLLKDLHLDKLTIKNKKTHIELTDINLGWSSVIYQDGKLHIDQLKAQSLNIYLAKKDNTERKKVVIPRIPIPIDMLSNVVILETLNIINAEEKLIFQIKDMEVTRVSIIDNLLTGATVKATPIVKDSPMAIRLQKAEVDFDQPHDMKGSGTINYAHIQMGEFDGNVSVGGTLTDYEIEGVIDWEEQIIGTNTVEIKGYGDYDKAEITDFSMHNESADLEADGQISWIDEFKWNINIEGDDVRTKKYNSAWPAQFDITMLAQGSYRYKDQKWQLSFDTKSLEGKLDKYPLKASGEIILEDGILGIRQVDIKSGRNKILMGGKITEPFDLKWDIDVKNVSELLPEAKGSINGKGTLTGTTIKPSGRGKLLIKGFEAEGVKIGLADVELKGGADGSLMSSDGRARIKDFKYEDITIKEANIDFDGKERQSLLLGKGKVRLTQVHSKKFDLESADLTFNGNQNNLDIQGVVKRLKLAGQMIDTAKVKTKGTIENHKVQLTAKSKEGDLTLQAKGAWLNSKWKGQINRLKVNNTAAGSWVLKKQVSLTASAENFTGSEICINNPKRGNICSTVTWNNNEGIKAKGKLNRVPLTQLKPWLPEGMELAGTVNGRYDIKQKKSGFYGKATFNLANSFVRFNTGKSVEKLAYHDGKITIKFEGRKITSNSTLQITKRGKLTTKSVVILEPSTGKHRIKGEAKFDMTHLRWIHEFFPDIKKLNGKLSSKVTIRGLLQKPVISGQLTLKNGQIKIPDTGTHLSRINLNIQSESPTKAKILGSLFVGQGKLDITGSMDFKKINVWAADVRLKGNNLLFMNTHEVKAYASPDIRINATKNAVRITGSLHLPKASLTISEIPQTAVYESEDVVFVGEKKKNAKGAVKEKPLNIIPNINISLGEQISFNGFGLTGKLKGSFVVSKNRNVTLARGTVKIIDGQYRAYGQRLAIEQGVIVFNGPLNRPGLNIRATRSVGEMKVGLHLAGTLQQPKSTVFSDPPQPESDALSYLLTGQSLANVSGNETQLLMQAVRTLGINSGSNLLNRLGGSIGLDDVNVITHEDYKKSKLQLGKRLGTDLYIRYITGIFDTFHKIAVDYKISKRWSLQAESGEEEAVDFIYELR